MVAEQSGASAARERIATVVPIPRRHASTLSYKIFLRDYVVVNRPVIVEDAVTDWPALHKWKPEFFKANFGSRRVPINYEAQMTFADFIEAALASSEQAPAPYMYRLFIGPHLPELLPDVLPHNAYEFPRRSASPLMLKPWRRPDGYLKLLIGRVGGRFPILHYDGENMHAAVTEIHGTSCSSCFRPRATNISIRGPHC